jgi:DNA invertase Pin-like site-specific DNA recombinase
MKAVILTRVSSQEQKNGKSLKAQIENAQRYAGNKKTVIID